MSVPGVAMERERNFGDAVTGRGLMVSGKHPIAGLRRLKQGELMTLISRYPLSQAQQALLATQDGSLPALMAEYMPVAAKLGPSDEPPELKTEVEDCPNNGVGE